MLGVVGSSLKLVKLEPTCRNRVGKRTQHVAPNNVAIVWPRLYMFTPNTIAQALGCYPWKQLYLITFVDLVLVATEKVVLSGQILFGIGGRVI